jgi:hypothetical protein
MTDYDELAERLVGGMLGYGRQHKAFLYSKPDLTAEEKARERSAHYRKKKQVAEERLVSNRKATIQPPRRVTWTDEDKAREEARGLKEKAPTLPKKGSERKPYVGSVMKKKLLDALGLEEDSKEGRKALRVASRKYKEGGVSWEEVIASAR